MFTESEAKFLILHFKIFFDLNENNIYYTFSILMKSSSSFVPSTPPIFSLSN